MSPADTMSIVVLSDVHANARAFRAALAQARQGPCDRIVILGDLLTYGPDVTEVLDLVAKAESEDRAAVIIGNHDQLYFDLAAGDSPYYDEVPDWLRESIDWTNARVDGAAMRSRFRWLHELVMGDWLFAHANPFGFGDWRYLRSDEDLCEAARWLGTRMFRGGVFGHVHRPRLALISSDGHSVERQSGVALAVSTTELVMGGVAAIAGSIGQPRGAGPAATMLRMQISPVGVTLTTEPVEYDVRAHTTALASMDVSEATHAKLASFFAR